jgi:uncharacterized protein
MLPLARAACIALLLLPLWHAQAETVPQLSRYATDLAGVLAQQDLDRLEAFLQDYERQTSNQFVLLIVPSVEDYSLRVAEQNGIGKRGKDNGLLFLVAINDRAMRFEVGYGLEGVLTDALTSVIIRDIVAPEFRRGDYMAGVSAGLQAAVKAASGEFTAEDTPRSDRAEKKGGNLFGLVLFLIILFFVLKNRKGGRGGGIFFIGPFGGGFGGGGGGSFGGGGFSGFSGGGGSFGGGGSSGSW